MKPFVLPEKVEMAPAPLFIFGTNGSPSLAKIYLTHYDRLRAVVAAARSGDPLLVKLALAYHDEHGCKDVPK